VSARHPRPPARSPRNTPRWGLKMGLERALSSLDAVGGEVRGPPSDTRMYSEGPVVGVLTSRAARYTNREGRVRLSRPSWMEIEREAVDSTERPRHKGV